MSNIGEEEVYYDDEEEVFDDDDNMSENGDYEEEEDEENEEKHRSKKRKIGTFQKWTLITLVLVLVSLVCYLVFRHFEDERLRQDRADTYMTRQKDSNVRAIFGLKQQE